jgi:hypothetical protein
VDNINLLQEWNAPKPMHESLLNQALQWTIVSTHNSDENWNGYIEIDL